MNPSPTANQLGGRAVGSIFFTGFGSLWLFLALYAKEQLSVATVSGVALATLLLVLAAMHLRRVARRFPRLPDDPATGRAFGWINAIQWIAVAVAAFTLAKLNLDAYVMNAITAIVGLHMFPLARVFRYPVHYATGGALVAWAVFAGLLVPIEQMQGVTALGTGIILWLSAAVTLVLALKIARQPALAQSI